MLQNSHKAWITFKKTWNLSPATSERSLVKGVRNRPIIPEFRSHYSWPKGIARGKFLCQLKQKKDEVLAGSIILAMSMDTFNYCWQKGIKCEQSLPEKRTFLMVCHIHCADPTPGTQRNTEISQCISWGPRWLNIALMYLKLSTRVEIQSLSLLQLSKQLYYGYLSMNKGSVEEWKFHGFTRILSGKSRLLFQQLLLEHIKFTSPLWTSSIANSWVVLAIVYGFWTTIAITMLLRKLKSYNPLERSHFKTNTSYIS